MATFMGHEDGSIPAVLNDREASRLLAQHSLTWGDVRHEAATGDNGHARALRDQHNTGRIRLSTLAAYLGY